MEILYKQFKEVKLVEFEKNWLKFMKLKNESLDNEFNKENIDCILAKNISKLSQNENPKLELNGSDFINGHSSNRNEGCANTTLSLDSDILKFAFKKFDCNPSIRKVKAET